jgi:pimeloyl-ACP methyl ester carboxylesterase
MSELRNRHLVTEDGVRLNVIEAGRVDAPPMVFVHGLASSWTAWEHVLALPQLTERYRLIAFDLRGHGASDTALKPEQLTAQGVAANAKLWSLDIDAVVAGLRSPVLVGWSLGGGLVQSWLYTHGGTGGVAAAVLACVPSVIGPVPPGDPAEGLVSQQALMALARAAEDGRTFASAILATSADDSSASPDQRDSIVAVAETTPPETVAAALHHGYDFRAFLAGLPAADRDRITAVVADGDQIFDSAATETVWRQAAVRTVHVPAAAHALPIGDPARFAQVLLDAVARNR